MLAHARPRKRQRSFGTDSAPRAAMRALRPILLFIPLVVAGCPESHGVRDDAGTTHDGGTCGGFPSFSCVSDCGSDALYSPVCEGDAWVCPPGTRDTTSCPPTCHGPPPPGCTCVGTEWRCDGTCPADLNPWDPTDPRNACAVEGAECTSGGTDPCGGATFCSCREGRWQCGVAEPDPVCYCGREPSEGDRCAEEGATCGECCPTPGGTGWAPMACEGGRWTAAACPAIECPPLVITCPAQTASALGQPCDLEGSSCGDPCCGDAIVCEGGRWQPGPTLLCAVCQQFPCGAGACHDGQYCHQACGPADGIVHLCEPAPAGCASCECIPLWETQRCEMIDGRPRVTDLGGCG